MIFGFGKAVRLILGKYLLHSSIPQVKSIRHFSCVTRSWTPIFIAFIMLLGRFFVMLLPM